MFRNIFKLRFKLPRNQFGFVGIRDHVNSFVNESLPQHTHEVYRFNTTTPGGSYIIPCLIGNTGQSAVDSDETSGAASSTYQDNAPVQQRAIQVYLEFYLN